MLPIDCFVTTHEKLTNDKAIFKMRTWMAIWIDILHLFSYMPNWPQSVVCKSFKSLISEGVK